MSAIGDFALYSRFEKGGGGWTSLQETIPRVRECIHEYEMDYASVSFQLGRERGPSPHAQWTPTCAM